ncbi:replication initiation protein [Marinomonas sp. TI.3.20]|uniref:replication initiation protein n=1 Tax=Marinomonas sp. TI.3.20 TaxID=3121296 RepID=UPI00311EB72D
MSGKNSLFDGVTGSILEEPTSDLFSVSEYENFEEDDMYDEKSEVEFRNSQHLIVYKDNALIFGRYGNLNAVELKLVNALIAKVNPYSDSIGMMSFTRKELVDMGVATIQWLYKSIDAITYKLQQQVIRLPKKNPKTGAVDNILSYDKVNLFYKSSWDDDTGEAQFMFHPDIQPYLINLRSHFTKYHLHQLHGLSSYYSIRLYELFRSFLSLRSVQAGNFKLTRNVQYATLRDLLDVGNKFKRFNQFQELVLDLAVKELQKTDINVTYSLPDRRKANSRVAVKTIRFEIEARFGYRLDSDDMEVDMAILKNDTYRQLLQFLASKNASALLDTYGVERCLSNLELLQSQNKKSVPIKNASAWLVKAIENDYANSSSNGPALEELLGLYKEEDRHKRNFIEEQLLHTWNDLDSTVQKEFLTNRFDSGVVAMKYVEYLMRVVSGNKPEPVKPKLSKDAMKENKAAVQDALTNITDTNW